MSCNRLFLGTATLYTQRVCISVAAAPGAKARNSTEVGGAQNATVTMFSEFGWTNTDQGIVLGAFFNGYIFTQIVGGLLSKRYGGKLVLLACITLASLFTALTPLRKASLNSIWTADKSGPALSICTPTWTKAT